MDVSRKQNHV